MHTLQSIKKILHDRQLAPKKRLGQNFLIHKQTASRIVEMAGVGPEDTIVELGVGFGTLTAPLADKTQRVIGLEIDAGIVQWHLEEGNLPKNVTLMHQDLLKADFGNLSSQSGGRLKIMANLPYSISNPLLFKLIENRDIMDWAVLMLQKEVACRLTAKTSTKEYGILTVLLGACASVETLLPIGPGQFHPRPKVDSAVVRITFQPQTEKIRTLPDHDSRLLHKLVKAAFQQRRKTLLNSLAAANIMGLGKKAIGQILDTAGIPPGSRAENLAVEEYVRLANLLALGGDDKHLHGGR